MKYDDIPAFFDDLARHGCVSGWIDGLIYYSQTHAFFDHHYAEIEELREEWEESVGAPLSIQHDLKNFFAWFAFESVASEIAQELGFW